MTIPAPPHLQLTMLMLGHHSTGSGHHSSWFDELARSATRGAGWAMGNALVRHLPITVIAIALLGLAIVLFVRSRRNTK